MPTASDVAFGQVALAHGLLQQPVLAQVYAQLPAGTSLGDALVQRGLLSAEHASWILTQVQHRTADTKPDTRQGESVSTLADAGAVPETAGRKTGSQLPGIGDVIAGRYTVSSVLGKGGMGAVYRAHDAERGEDVAVKLLLRSPEGSTALARFRREAEAVAKVDQHVGIVRIRAFGEHNGAPYAVQDLVEGRDLRAIVKAEGPFPIEDALAYAEQVSRAIHHCHQLGVVHRDLKPANVLLRSADNTAHVTDFGLALDEQAERMTKTGTVMGTPAYMPPEQAEGDKAEIDALSDVYSLGAILYELVTGRPPFKGEPILVIKKVFLNLPDPLAKHRGGVSPELEAVCQKAMAKRKQDRYPSALAFAEDLGRLRRGDPVAVRPPSWRQHYHWKLSKKDKGAWALLLAGILAVVSLTSLPILYSIYLIPRLSFDEAMTGPQLAKALLQDPLLFGDRKGAQVDLCSELTSLGRRVDRLKALEGKREQSHRITYLSDLLKQARDTDGPWSAAASRLRDIGEDEPLALDRLDRLVARLTLHDTTLRFQLSPSLARQTDKDAGFLQALAHVHWGDPTSDGAPPPSPEDYRSAKELVAGLASQKTTPRLDRAVKTFHDLLGANGYMQKGEEAVLEGFRARNPRGTGWSNWGDVVAATPVHGRQLLNVYQQMHKVETFNTVIDTLIAALPAKDALAWNSAVIYKTLEHVLTLQLGPFTSGNTTGAPIPRDVVTVAYTKLLKEIVSRLSSKTDTDALFDGFVPFVDATPLRGRIAWQSDLDLRRGVCDLLGDCLASRADDLLKGLDTDQMPPGAVRTLLIFPRVQVISFPEATHILLRKLSDKARLRERLQKDPNGDGYVLWALITKTFTAGGRRGKASELLVVARRYAWALGKNLSAQEWDSLHLGKLPERPKSLDDAPWRPLSKHWLPVALLSLADVAIEKGLGAKGRAQRLRGAVALGRRVHADLDLVRQEAQPAMLKSLAAHVRGLRYAAGANAPEDTQLAKLEELYLDEGISASWARLSHVAATLGDPAKDGSSWFNVGSALPAAGTISKLSDMQMVKAESLLNDNPDGALRLLKETEQRLVELGHSNQADIVDKISWLCVRLNKPADAEREAKRLMKIGEELCALGNEQARRGGKAISRATCTLAHSALLRGDRETALRLYEGREEKREASVSRWRVLRNKLGLR